MVSKILATEPLEEYTSNDVIARRSGRVVCITVNNSSVQSAHYIIDSSHALPSRFRPQRDTYTVGRINTTTGFICVNANGNIEALNISNGSAVTGATKCRGTLTYIV